MIHVAASLWDPLHGTGYQLWSGILGSFIVSGGIWTGVIAAYRKHNCHSKGCWRIGKHALDGTPYVVCRHHHPHVPDAGATAEDIREHYRSAHAER